MRKRTRIDIDSQGFAAAMDRKPLAEQAAAVQRSCERHGCGPAGQMLAKPQGWISKMRRIAKAVKTQSVAGTLVLQGTVHDVEIAYYLSLIESKSDEKVREIADNINNETRQTVKRAWEELR